jgi:hypothetical protein
MTNTILAILFTFTPLYAVLSLLLTNVKYIDSCLFKVFLLTISVLGVWLGVHFILKI